MCDDDEVALLCYEADSFNQSKKIYSYKSISFAGSLYWYNIKIGNHECAEQ